ncbi:MAG: bifunctional homocysteine S-methyltransferase/methylenetetrahydrofolate reductase [Candidatus Poribacteria bacterium]|nr:bifunctional homocysteine S-methyltransferase/methylenetetrahydrofolate reductase [Candidatus Poribacteria bacterium]
MTTQSFLTDLKDRILVCDGAIGTQLRRRVPPYVQCLNACNTDADYHHIVRNIHREYRNAGADILQTNTFGANATKLKSYGFEERVGEINSAGAQLAREVAGTDRYVAGSVGPLEMDPLQETLSAKAIRRMFKTQMDALADGGVDLLALETFTDLEQTEIATKQALTYGLPVMVQISGVSGGKLSGGIDVRVFAQEIEKLGAHVIGLNCRGPHDLLEAVERLAPVLKAPISVQPNAGNPQIEQGRLEFTYSVNADVFDEYVQKLIKLGTNIIGGCCGTTPEYISKIKARVEGLTPVKRETRIFILPEVSQRRKPRPQENPIQQIFETRRNIISVEMRANTFIELRAMVKEARELAANGVDLFDVPDSAGAMVSIGAIGTSYHLQQETHIPTIIHWTTRQRNLISMQSHLLEAWTLGIRGLLALSGDHPKVGPYEDANLVRDVRGSTQLIALVSRLNNGELADGSSIGEPCNFYIGGGFTIAENLRPHVKHLTNKVKNGAKFIYTQPAYTLADIERTYEATKSLGVKILYGILPITSFRSVSFLRDNLGIYIPQAIVDQFRDVGASEGKKLGMKLTLELVRQICEQDRFPVDGLYIMPPPPMNWKNKRIAVSEIIRAYRGERE